MSQHACDHVANVHGSGRILQERQAHEEEREAKDELTDTLPMAFSTEYQWHTDSQHRNGKGRYVHLETYGRDNPCCDGSTNVGTHDDTNRLCQRHQSGIHKTHHHHRCSTRRLDKRRDENTRQHTHHTILRHGCQDTAQAVACKLFKALRHSLHTEEKQCQRADKRENVDNQIHCVVFCITLQRYFNLITSPLRRCYNPVTSVVVTKLLYQRNAFVTF